jgi:hypothetical protein
VGRPDGPWTRDRARLGICIRRKFADREGFARFPGLPEVELLVGVKHSEHGHLHDVPLRAGPDGGAQVLRLPGGADLRLLIADGSHPLPGVKVQLYSSVRNNDVDERSADARGIVTFPRLAPGRYQAWIDHVGCFAQWHAFDFSGEAAPIPLAVRRTGNLQLLLRDLAGQPVVGTPVELHAIELGRSVADWVAEHRVSAEPEDLCTDSAGRLFLQGLPRGPYRLALNSPSGQAVVLQVEVPARSKLELPLSLE